MVRSVHITTLDGNVVLRNYYEPDVRANLQAQAEWEVDLFSATRALWTASIETEQIAECRGALVVFYATNDLLFLVVGSDDEDEFALSDVVATLIAVVRDIVGKKLAVDKVVAEYPKLALSINEVIKGGLIDALSVDVVSRMRRMKDPTEVNQ